ncbi:MAG TPA: hypothetical protein VE986_04555 [Hyphomicrobiales bacterium]|nr:hypothetical protein [Hyphomicrobiales bacterium]
MADIVSLVRTQHVNFTLHFTQEPDGKFSIMTSELPRNCKARKELAAVLRNLLFSLERTADSDIAPIVA